MDMNVTKRDGSSMPFDMAYIEMELTDAGIPHERVMSVLSVQLRDGITTAEIQESLIRACLDLIKYDPAYDRAAAALFLRSVFTETSHFVGGIRELSGLLDDRMQDYDLEWLERQIDYGRDSDWTYMGIKTIYDRYLLKVDGRRVESPQSFWMRVAMGLALGEDDPSEWVVSFYNVLSQKKLVCSTPTLFNAGTVTPQLSSCYLTTLEDSIDGIFDGGVRQQARLAKHAGGQGIDVTPLRASGTLIAGTGGPSNGIVPWLKVMNATMVAVDQGGKRAGAGVAYLEPWHLDIEDFIQLRKNTGDERRRTHDLHLALWIPDRFMEEVEADGEWKLFCPSVFAGHSVYGDDFSRLYDATPAARTVSAKGLWKTILRSVFETGYPWITFKDPGNMRYPNNHAGVVHSSNLCTEIFLASEASTYDRDGNKTSTGETAVCNLASVNLARVGDDLGAVVATGMRMLDNVIDLNYYPTSEARNANIRHRPVGLGVMGLHEGSDRVEEVAYHAIAASAELAQERGSYSSFAGSLWDQGVLPIDSYYASQRERFPDSKSLGFTSSLDYRSLRIKVALGMRNSCCTAIAPTATIADICGVTQSIEPSFGVLRVRSSHSGEFLTLDSGFVEAAKEAGIWTDVFADQLVAANGDLSVMVKYGACPAAFAADWPTAFQVDQMASIDRAAARGRWLCQGQSFNLYYEGDSLREVNDLFIHAWKSGLKSTYYLRSKAASAVEQSVCESCQ